MQAARVLSLRESCLPPKGVVSMSEIYRVRIWIGGSPLTSLDRFLSRDDALDHQQQVEYIWGIPAIVLTEQERKE